MASLKFKFTVDGEQVLQRQFRNLENVPSDLTQIWKPVKEKFQEFSSDLFQSGGSSGKSGKWAKLSDAYEKRKTAKFGTFALLAGVNIRTERLYKSLSGDTDDTVYLPAPQSLTLGTSVPYARFVQKARPVISLTDKQLESIGDVMKKGVVGEVKKRTTLVIDADTISEFGNVF